MLAQLTTSGARQLGPAGPSPSDLDAIVQSVAQELIGRSVSADSPLMDAGLDSLGATELRTRLAQQVDNGASLPETLVFDFPTLRHITAHLVSTAPVGASTKIEMDTSSLSQLLAQLTTSGARQPSPAASSALKHERASTQAFGVQGCALVAPNGIVSSSMLREALILGNNAISVNLSWDNPSSSKSSPEAFVSYAAGGFVRNVECFDNLAFRCQYAEAEAMDPQQHSLLEVGYSALHDASHYRATLDGQPIGTFVGMEGNDFQQALTTTQVDGVYAATSSRFSVASGRLPYVLGLVGPSVAYVTACSAALVACHGLLSALRLEESDIGVTMAVNFILTAEVGIAFAQAGLTSKRGRSYVFDRMADGYVRSEAVGGCVISESSINSKVAQKEACLVAGCAVRQDGRRASLIAPSGIAQQALYKAALGQAGLAANALESVEAAANGSAVGDTIEVSSISSVMSRQGCVPLLVHNAKGSVGHGEPASGGTGLVKVVMELSRPKILAPNATLRVTKQAVERILRDVKCILPAQMMPSCSNPGQNSFAGLSSFGFSGTIGQAILCERGAFFPLVSGKLVYRRNAFSSSQRRALPSQNIHASNTVAGAGRLQGSKQSAHDVVTAYFRVKQSGMDCTLTELGMDSTSFLAFNRVLTTSLGSPPSTLQYILSNPTVHNLIIHLEETQAAGTPCSIDEAGRLNMDTLAGIRVVAAIWVFMFHWQGLVGPLNGRSLIIQSPFIGIFALLAGFYAHLVPKVQINDIRKVFWRDAFPLLPAFWFCFLLTVPATDIKKCVLSTSPLVLFESLMTTEYINPINMLFYHTSSLQQFGIFGGSNWYVAAQILFLLIFGTTRDKCEEMAARYPVRLTIILMTMSIFRAAGELYCALIIDNWTMRSFFHRCAWTRVPEFALGVLLSAIVKQTKMNNEWRLRLGRCLDVVMALSLVLLSFESSLLFLAIVADFWLGFIIICSCVSSGSMFCRAMSFFALYEKYTYSMYVAQVPVLVWVSVASASLSGRVDVSLEATQVSINLHAASFPGTSCYAPLVFHSWNTSSLTLLACVFLLWFHIAVFVTHNVHERCQGLMMQWQTQTVQKQQRDVETGWHHGNTVSYRALSPQAYSELH